MVVEGDKVFLNSTFMGAHTGAIEFAPSTPSGERWGFPESRPSSLAGGRIFDEHWAGNDIPGLIGKQAAAEHRYMDEASNKGNASIVDMG